MESHTLHMITMKALLLAVLALTASACGIKVNDDGEDEAKDSSASHEDRHHDDDDDDDQKNEVILITDGSYGVEVSSTDIVCEKLGGGDTTALRFKAPEGGDDAGLEVQMLVTGDFSAGDALTPDNSDGNRYFDFQLTTPAGDHYAYSSSGKMMSTQPDYAALTILKATDYVTAGRLWIENLALKAAADGSEPARALSVRGSFECADWE